MQIIAHLIQEAVSIMKRLRVGIIGTGMAFEWLHYPAYQELSDRYEIAALCDVNKNAALSWGQRLGISAIT